MEIGEPQARGVSAGGRGAVAARLERAVDTGSQAAGGPSQSLDPVDLTAEAAALVDGDDAPGRGRSADSPAFRARALIAEYPHLSALPFGQVVSGLLHDTLDLEPPAATEESAGQDALGGEAADDGTALEGGAALPPLPDVEPETEPEPAVIATPPDGGSTLASILADALSAEDDGGLQPTEI